MSKNLQMQRLDRLIEPAKSKAREHIAAANRAGIFVCVVATERTNAEQNALYAQGRTKPGKKVTNARGGDSIHNYRLAWDLCPVVDGKLAWDRIDLFDKLGVIAVKLGVTWGGNFKLLVDKPHFQATGGLTLAGLKAGLKLATTAMPKVEPKPVQEVITVAEPTYKITVVVRGQLSDFKPAIEKTSGFPLYPDKEGKTLSTTATLDSLYKIEAAARAWSANYSVEKVV